MSIALAPATTVPVIQLYPAEGDVLGGLVATLNEPSITLLANNAPIAIDLSLAPEAVVTVGPDGQPVYVGIAPSQSEPTIAVEPSGFPIMVELQPFMVAPGGGGSGAETASEVSYTNSGYPSLVTVQEALDKLLYVNPQITNFTNNVGTVEIGTTITSVTLSWSFNKTMVSASIEPTIGALSLATSSDTVTGDWTANTSWTLTASDGTNTVSASTSISFDSKRYWGVSANDTLTTAEILALGSSQFAGNFDATITYDCAVGGVYPYFAYPAAWGTPANVTVGGLSFSAFTVTTQSFTNASGYTSDYNVIRFTGVQSGAAIAVVWE